MTTLIIGGTYNWYRSTWSGGGTMQVGALGFAASLNIVKPYRYFDTDPPVPDFKTMGRTLANYGTITYTAQQNLVVSKEIQNKSGAVFDNRRTLRSGSNSSGNTA